MDHKIPIGSKVGVRFQRGSWNGRIYPAGWRAATVIGHSRVGTAFGAGTPTYDVRLRDGNVIECCAVECVREV